VAAAPIWSVCGRGCRSTVAMVVRGTSFAEAWWSCGSAVKIENDGGAAIECARCRDDGGWMRERCATELRWLP